MTDILKPARTPRPLHHPVRAYPFVSTHPLQDRGVNHGNGSASGRRPPRPSARLSLGTMIAALIVPALSACSQPDQPQTSRPAAGLDARRVAEGDPQKGRAAISRIGCGVCHNIPGIPGASGIVGPSLETFARRQFIAGIVPNRPETLVRWISDAPSIAPHTAMPHLPISHEDAKHIAAYLYTLRK